MTDAVAEEIQTYERQKRESLCTMSIFMNVTLKYEKRPNKPPMTT